MLKLNCAAKSMSKNFYSILWLGIFNLPLALFFGSSYAPALASSPWFVIFTFASAAVGVFFFNFVIASLVLIFPVLTIKKRVSKTLFCYLVAVVAFIQFCLAFDSKIFSIFQAHMGAHIFDLMLNSAGIGSKEALESNAAAVASMPDFGVAQWLTLAFHAILCVANAIITIFLALLLGSRGIKCRLIVLFIAVIFIIANLIHAYANAKQLEPVVEIGDRIPLYAPLTMNKAMLKWNLISEEDLIPKDSGFKVKEGEFAYPKEPLAYLNNASEPYNVLVICVGSLRADMLSEETMPNLSAYAKKGYNYTNHYAASNTTKESLFGLFYGLPPSYYAHAVESQTAPLLTGLLKKRNYHYEVFSGANLVKQKLYNSVFLGLEDSLRINGIGTDALSRDNNAIYDFSRFIERTPKEQKFFAFVYLNSLASYAYPSNYAAPYTPAATFAPNEALFERYQELSALRSKLGKADISNDLADGAMGIAATLGAAELAPLDDSEVELLFNRYRNAAHYADENLKRLLSIIEHSVHSERTIVVITSDHGEEFNDNGIGVIGHGSNFSDAQLKVPLVVTWPNKGSKVVDHLTASYDLSATFLSRVLGVRNLLEDFCIGEDLFKVHAPKYILAGSKSENAVIERKRIVLIDHSGNITFKSKSYQEASNQTRDGYIFDAINLMGTFIKSPEVVENTQEEQEVAAQESASEDAENKAAEESGSPVDADKSAPDSVVSHDEQASLIEEDKAA